MATAGAAGVGEDFDGTVVESLDAAHGDKKSVGDEQVSEFAFAVNEF